MSCACRAIAGCTIPVISAVGHETDTTLADFAADLRAPTPTAAAELAVPVREELLNQLAELALRKRRAVNRPLQLGRERLAARSDRLPVPQSLLTLPAQRLDDMTERLRRGLGDKAGIARDRLGRAAAGLSLPLLRSRAAQGGERLDGAGRRLASALLQLVRVDQARLERSAAGLRVQPLRNRVAGERQRLARAGLEARLIERRFGAARDRLAAIARVLGQLDPDKPLARGFARVMDTARQTLTSRERAADEPALILKFADGELSVATSAVTPPQRKRASSPPLSQDRQGDLF